MTIIPFKPPDRLDGFEEQRRWLAGEGHCLACHHEWAATVPAGTIELECPSCGFEKGVLKKLCEPDDGMVWTCSCGCNLFRLTKTSVMCVLCGTEQVFNG